MSTASTGQVKEQAIITSRIIKERIRRDNLAAMEKLHQKESSGPREEQLEQEQIQQEYVSESDQEDLEDYLGSSEPDLLPQSVVEPAIELTIDAEISQALKDIQEPQSMSLLFPELEGENEAYPD